MNFACFSLLALMKRVVNPADCTSAERTILAYLYDLYTSCSSILKVCNMVQQAKLIFYAK